MKMSAEGRRRLTQREGVRLNAYRDSVGVWTIGIGHTAAAGDPRPYPGMRITAAEADAILSRDLVQYENAVSEAVKVQLTQYEFDALVSFCFNIGTGGLRRSTCVRMLNMGKRLAAADAMLMWDRPPEIIGRRRSERAQFLTPYTVAAPPPATKSARQTPKPTPAPAVPSRGLWAAIAAMLARIFRKG